MSDILLEYTGTTPERFEAWQNVLLDVGFARAYGPSPGQPGYDAWIRQAAQAIDLLQPHLDVVARRVEIGHPFVTARLEAIQRSLEDATQPLRSRKLGDVGLDLSHIMDDVEVLLLGLIGPEGQSPVGRCSVEVPTQPYLAAWLRAATGTPNLVPNAESTQVLSWRTDRAWLPPAQAGQLAELEPRDVSYEACCSVLRRWNDRSSTKVWIPSSDPQESRRYEEWQVCFVEALHQLQSGLGEIAERGEVYLGWTTWTGYE